MDIAYVIEHFSPSRGGAEHYVHTLIKKMSVEGHSITVYCRDTELSSDCGADIVIIPAVSWGGFAASLTFILNCRKRLKKQAHHIVHVMGHVTFMNVFQPHGGVFLRSVLQNIRACRTLPGRILKTAGSLINPKKLLFALCEYIQYKVEPTPVCIAISEFVRNDMLRVYSIPEERVHLLWNAVEIRDIPDKEKSLKRKTLRASLCIDENVPVFLFAAHNFKLKGLDPLLKAFRLVTDSYPEARLIIAGAGRIDTYTKKAGDLVDKGSVIFMGRVEPLSDYYCACDCFVMPTFFDPCSIAAIEALCSGVPLITTRFNGTAAFVEQGISGHIIKDPHDISSLAEALMKLCASERRPIPPQTRQRLRETFSMERHYRDLMDIYARAVNERVRSLAQ